MGSGGRRWQAWGTPLRALPLLWMSHSPLPHRCCSRRRTFPTPCVLKIAQAYLGEHLLCTRPLRHSRPLSPAPCFVLLAPILPPASPSPSSGPANRKLQPEGLAEVRSRGCQSAGDTHKAQLQGRGLPVYQKPKDPRGGALHRPGAAPID